jgi:predicted double-glycine peptidase
VILVLFEVSLSVEAAFIGAWAASRSQKFAAGLGVPLLGLVLLKFAAGHIPAAEARLLPWDWYPFVAPWWYLVPTMFLFGAALWGARPSPVKRDLLLVLAGLLLVRTGVVAWESRDDHARLRGTADDAGFCPQSAGYSCAPAAAVSFLHHYGVRATEREMAILCATRPGLGGTSECGVMRGLRLKLPHRAVRITACRADELPCPAVVSLRMTLLIAHCVVVVRVTPAEVIVMDPASGRSSMTRQAFEQEWTGSAIYVDALTDSPRVPARD